MNTFLFFGNGIRMLCFSFSFSQRVQIMKTEYKYGQYCSPLFFFYLGFFSQTFTNHRTAGEGGGHFFNFPVPLPPASWTLRHWVGYYCRKIISGRSQRSDSNREPLVSELKWLTTKLHYATRPTWFSFTMVKWLYNISKQDTKINAIKF